MNFATLLNAKNPVPSKDSLRNILGRSQNAAIEMRRLNRMRECTKYSVVPPQPSDLAHDALIGRRTSLFRIPLNAHQNCPACCSQC